MNEWIPRQEVLMIFINEDLIPFIKNKGYEFAVDSKFLGKVIARELFHALCDKVKKRYWHSNCPNKRYRIEDYDHFQYIFDSYVWQDFWSHVYKWQDVEENLNARSIVEFAAWACIDLSSSEQTSIVNEMINGGDESESDSDSDAKEKDRDPYNDD